MKNNEIMRDTLERPGAMKDVKILLVGPTKCGKTALVQRFVNNTFCDTYIPTGFEKYSAKNKVDELTVEYSIWDTSGSVAYDTVRPLAYQDANVFLLCFNISDSESLDQAVTKFFPEIRQHCINTPIILCGCRSDCRVNLDKIPYNSLNKSKTTPCSQEQILDVCKTINASMYVETSSLYSNIGVPDAFESAAKAALGLFNKPANSKNNKKLNNSTSNNNNSNSSSNHNINLKNKTNIKSELKGKAKNCSVM